MAITHFNAKNTFRTKAQAQKAARERTKRMGNLTGGAKMSVRRIPASVKADFPTKRYVIGFR